MAWIKVERELEVELYFGHIDFNRLPESLAVQKSISTSLVEIGDPIIMQKHFVVIIENTNGTIVTQSTFDTLKDAEDCASREVSDGYKIGNIYERVKACRAPAPEVEWVTPDKKTKLLTK